MSVVQMSTLNRNSRGVDISDVKNTYEHSSKSFFGYAYALTSSSDVAKDLVQNVFAKIIAKIKRDGKLEIDNLEAYVIRAIRNEHINRTAKEIRHTSTLTLVRQDAPSAEIIHFDEIKNTSLSHAIQKLPTAQRTCIVMYYFDGLKVDEISNSLGISKSAVKTHIQRARKALGKFLDDEQEGDAI